MKMLRQGFSLSIKKRNAFTIVEVMIALFFVSLVIAIIGGLGQQVASLVKKSVQTGAVLEIRSSVNSITKNSDAWLVKMRGSMHTKGIYAGCIPDPKLNISTFSCPATNSSYFSDKELSNIAGPLYHVTSAPIVNSNGELIAGSVDEPLYLNDQGRSCKSSDISNCSLKSTGFFLRTNPNSNEDPGSVKFVIKIEANFASTRSSSTPMKAQYMSVDVGDDWKNPIIDQGNCPQGTIKIGYMLNGAPSCINPSKQCSSGQFPIGVDDKGVSICKSLPDCTSQGGYISINSNGDDLVCATSSPCGMNNLFLGYFGGSGEPMCSGSQIKCNEGELQVGMVIQDGKMSAKCSTPPVSCTNSNERISFNGVKFVCERNTTVQSCPANQVMAGIRSDGTPDCISAKGALTSNDLECPAGKVMYGIERDGKVKCRDEVSSAFRIESSSGDGVIADQCTGSNVGGFCSVFYSKQILFSQSFNSAPKVVVSLSQANVQACGSTSDRDVAYATNITTTGFTLICSSSPHDSCTESRGAYGGWMLMSRCNWIAIGER